jgi:DNA replication protein DnaC
VFVRAAVLLKALSQARADHSFEQTSRRYLAAALPIVDDCGLHRLTGPQGSDLYELVSERHRRASCVLTSNRSVDEWLGLVDAPLLGNSALDRLANAAHHLVLAGPSYRARLAPNHRRPPEAGR